MLAAADTQQAAEIDMADIVLIQPKFDPTYWGFDYALPLFRKTALLPPLNLALLAALTPGRSTRSRSSTRMSSRSTTSAAAAPILSA